MNIFWIIDLKIKKARSYMNELFLRLTRFERATPTSAGWCSNPAELQSQDKKNAAELLSRKRQELNLPTPFGSDGLAIRCITALPRFLISGARGIRTPGPVKINGFQDRPSTTALVSLQYAI